MLYTKLFEVHIIIRTSYNPIAVVIRREKIKELELLLPYDRARLFGRPVEKSDSVGVRLYPGVIAVPSESGQGNAPGRAAQKIEVAQFARVYEALP